MIMSLCICLEICLSSIFWGRKLQRTPVFLPGKSHGWSSLVGYSPWGCKESDTTEQLHFTSLQYSFKSFYGLRWLSLFQRYLKMHVVGEGPGATLWVLRHFLFLINSLLKGICCCHITSVVSDSVQPHRRQPTRLPRPWDSPGKNTGVGCHFLLQCMKVKSESEVAAKD